MNITKGVRSRINKSAKNHKCDFCGREEKDFKNEVEITWHHIMPLWIERDNRPYNLAPLCDDCHGKIEAEYYNLLGVIPAYQDLKLNQANYFRARDYEESYQGLVKKRKLSVTYENKFKLFNNWMIFYYYQYTGKVCKRVHKQVFNSIFNHRKKLYNNKLSNFKKEFKHIEWSFIYYLAKKMVKDNKNTQAYINEFRNYIDNYSGYSFYSNKWTG